VLEQFRGDIEQTPPMYSALKHQGQPLYKLARQGIEIERKARAVTIFSLDVLSFQPGSKALLALDVHCSKGTYIRSLAEDIGNSLGCGGHVASLHRTASGEFWDRDSISLDALIAERGEQSPDCLDYHLLPVDAPITDLPRIELPDQSVYYFGQGQAVMVSEVYRFGEEGGMVRVFSAAGEFLGVAEITDDGRIAPKRLVVRPDQ